MFFTLKVGMTTLNLLVAFRNLKEGIKNVNSKNPNPIFLKGLRALNHDPKMGLGRKCVQNTTNRITAYLATVFNYFNGCNNQPNRVCYNWRNLWNSKIVRDSSIEKLLLPFSSNYPKAVLGFPK